MLQERCHHQHDINLIDRKDRENDSNTNVILFLNENDLSVSFLNIWGVRSQCYDHLDHLCSSATTDLSLATLLKTAVFVPFFMTRKAFIKTRNRCIFLHPHQTGDFSDAHCSFVSAPGTSQMSTEKVHQPNDLQQNNEMLLGYMSVKLSSLSCQSASRHCAHGSRPDCVIINKRTRNCIWVCRQLSHEITKKGD